MTDATSTIPDVTEATFPDAVLAASHERPVVVDFWAAWCGPCHQLSPLIARVAARHAGEVDLVKVDVDAAPNLARTYRIQGIPAVKAFRDAQVVAEFVGVQPEPVIAQFFTALAPTEADRLAEGAAAAPPEEAEALLRRALTLQPDHPRATVALARLLADRGEDAEAVALLQRLPTDPEARRLLAQLRLRDAAAGEDLDALRAAADAGDPQARLRLGQGLAGRGDYDGALAQLVAAAGHPATREPARAAAVDLFAALGDDGEVVRRWRPRLAAALY